MADINHDNDLIKLARGPLRELHDRMEHLGETDMGDLTYAEAALFHAATDLVERLLDSIYDRLGKETGVAEIVPDYIDIEDDRDGLSAGKRAMWGDNPGRAFVVLEAIAFHDGVAIDSLSDIDFFEDADDWVRGRFHRVSDIPERCEHLRGIARDMNLPE